MKDKKKNDPTAWIVIGFIVVAFIVLVAFVVVKVVLPGLGGSNDFGPPVEMQPEPNPDAPQEVEAQPLPESEGMQPEPNPEEPQ